MAFCTLDKRFANDNYTNIENAFIQNYVPLADGNAVRVYLYGLFLCQNYSDAFSSEEMATALELNHDDIVEYFKYWQDFDLVSVISENPLTVKYQPLPKYNKPRKYKAEKYTDFSLSLQSLLPERMITPSEYSEYYDLMEDTKIKPEALLMIIKYCTELKGTDISYKYISKTVRNFAERNLITMASIEEELSKYQRVGSDIGDVFKQLDQTHIPEVKDLELYNKWVDFGYTKETILYICSLCKKKDISYLNGVIENLHEKELYSIKEIENYNANRKKINETAKEICNALSYKCDILDTFVNNYLNNWLQLGYEKETLVYIATFLYRHNYKTPDRMDDFINKLHDEGSILLDQVAYYIERLLSEEKFIKELLNKVGILRRPTSHDTENVNTWRSWGFTDEIIVYACTLSADKNNPFVYVNAILSQWKSKGIFTIEEAKEYSPVFNVKPNGKSNNGSFENERHYTKEELDKFISDPDDIHF